MNGDCYPLPAPRMAHYHWKAYLSFFLLALFPLEVDSAGVNFSQCLADVIDCANNGSSQACISLNVSNATAFSLLRSSKGTPLMTTDTATALSYHGCSKYCGAGQAPFSWAVFSQDYAQWLLPYLALLSQLPFGSRWKTDNLMSVILTLGSPTLAGYSLYMTLLNARWVNNQLFSGVDYPSATVRRSVVQVLSGLQQVPLRIHPGNSARFESLVVHPDNDGWWITLAAELDYSYTWSIAAAISITWVVIAYLLTVTDSLSNVAKNIQSNNGQGIGSVWLWLLPIVVGWLIFSPKCDYDRVHHAYRKANRQVFVADHPTATRITSNFGLTISPTPYWRLYDRNITSPDEARTPPVFNYARTLSWARTVYVTSLYYRTAWRKAADVGVDGNPIPENIRNDILRESRLGNRDQIIRYCQPSHLREYPGVNVLWPRGVLFNMIVASLMSLQLQFGTTGAAVLVAWFTPTIGLGCRSLAYTLYAMVSTAVWILLLTSSILGYYAHHHHLDDPPTPNIESDGNAGTTVPMQRIRSPNGNADVDAEQHIPPNNDEPTAINHSDSIHARTISRVADWLRWIGKSLAIVNAIGIVTNSIFQFSGVYNNCYCDSSVLYWGRSSAFFVISPNKMDINLARSAWIGAVALGLSCCAFFVGTIYLIRDSLPS